MSFRSAVRAQLTAALALGFVTSTLAPGCATYDDKVSWPQLPKPAAGPGLRMRWVKELAPKFGGLYRPVERAAAAIDTARGRIYIGSTQRSLWSLGTDGRQYYRYVTESGIEAEPTLDASHDELYVATVNGTVHALHADSGKLRWKAELAAPVSRAGVLSDDALYLVTDEDSVFAFSRQDGSVLWRYKREPRAGLQVAGHAGISITDHRLFTAFTDGTIVALSPGDGRVLWSIDTTLDFADPAKAEKGFVDIDTTPVQIGETVYAASFVGGLYAIDAARGEVQTRRPELTGITSLAAADNALVIGSSKDGVMCLDLPDLQTRWTHAVLRGAPGTVTVIDDTIYVTETRGAFLTLQLGDGSESGRLQTEYGFTAMPSLRDGQGFILGNAAVLYAFDY